MDNRSKTLFTPTTRQGLHAVALVILSLPVFILSNQVDANHTWMASALVTAFLHQGLVAAVWRSELFYNTITRIFSRRGFYYYGALFFFLIMLRFLTAAGASLATPGSLPLPAALWWATGGTFTLLFLWLQYSVLRFFGLKRALGADHFFPEYKTMPFVRRGIYRYTPNGMYTFGTLAFLLPGLYLRSQLGLAVGLFHYLAVWVHYWATELPDMEFIYGKTP